MDFIKLLTLILLLSSNALAGRLMDTDFASEAELTSRGASKQQLLNTSKIYDTDRDDTLDNILDDTAAGINLKADIASPTFTGSPMAPTVAPGDNSTKIATTSFVQAALDARGELPNFDDYPKSEPILNLDFANTKTLDPRITFSRTSSRTCINKFGLVYTLEVDEPCFDHDPATLESKGLLIEESRTNLLTHSNQFDAAPWSRVRVNIQQGAGTGPFGSLTAWRVTDTTENSVHDLRYTFTPTGNTTYTMTVFVKYDEGSPIEHAQVMIGSFAQQVASNTIVINLKNGSFTATDSSRTRVRSVNGGYLVSSTVTTIATPTTSLVPQVFLHNGTSSTYAGTGTGSILVSDFQLEVGSSPTSTLPSVETFTSRASTATYIDSTGKIATAAINAPRLSYNPENLNVPPKLLLEGESTNLALWSDDFSNAYWGKGATSVSTTAILAPDGVSTMFKLTEDSTTGGHNLTRQFSFVSGTTYTWSVFVKEPTNNLSKRYISVYFQATAFTNATGVVFDAATGEVTATFGAVIYNITKLPSGIYRVSITATATASVNASVYARLTNANNSGLPSYTGDNTSGIYIWRANLTEGYLSSSIKTEGTAVTRSADAYTSSASTRAADLASITGANFSSWYNQSEGTFVARFYRHGQGIVSGGGVSTPRIIQVYSGTDNFTARVFSSTSMELASSAAVAAYITRTWVPDSSNLMSVAYKSNDYAFASNGSVGMDSTSSAVNMTGASLGANSSLNGGFLNGHISHLRYYPKRLTNNELQAVTKDGIVGGGANQSPLNAHLGELAYLDKNQLPLDDIQQDIDDIQQDITALNTVLNMSLQNNMANVNIPNAALSAGKNLMKMEYVATREIVNGGTAWTSRTSAANNPWYSVTYGNGLFVAVSTFGTGNRVMTSPDGITWTIRTSAADNNWYSVTYGNGLFVAVASTGTGNRVMTSPDGITWTIRTSAADNNWKSVTYGNGLFVAVSDTGAGNRVMTSPDGITWTTRTSAADNQWYSVTYGNGLFVAVSASGTGNRVMTSPDGITWTSRTSADNNWKSVTYGNGLFVAVSDTGAGNRVMTSPDGITWTTRTSAWDNTWNSVTYGNGLFVAVAGSGSGTGNRVMTSLDGITWTTRTSAADNSWYSVTYANGLFVAVSASGTGNRVMTSPITSTFYTTSGESVIQRKGATFVHTSVRATGDTTQVSVNNSGDQMRVTTSNITPQTGEHSEIRYKISEM